MVDRADRRHTPGSSGATTGDVRTPFAKDRDRILYTTNFQRLARVTQVVAPNERVLTHNRLTHSLEVAQIGRGLAEALLAKDEQQEAIQAAGGLTPEVVEAACLAHDLGHPPFGHVAEETLNTLLTDKGVTDGFEGNAQSFRIVTRLGVRYTDAPGLNLTRATLNGVLKYPWRRGESEAKPKKWGAYESEGSDLDWARELMPAPTHFVSIEAGLMDWADDVAYAVHDLDDFFRAGVIPLDRLTTDQNEQERFLEVELAREGVNYSDRDHTILVFADLMTTIPAIRPFRGTKLDRARMRSFTSRLIGEYINAVSIQASAQDTYRVQIEPTKEIEVSLLKGLTWYYVINSPSLVSQRYGQSNLIKSLFTILAEAAGTPGDQYIFPPFFQEQLALGQSDSAVLRTVADYIASMSEAQAVEIHQRLTGQSLGSGIDRVQ